jgi:hypothetical protein
MNVYRINKIIQRQLCPDTIRKIDLSVTQCEKSKSVQKKKNDWRTSLCDEGFAPDKVDKYINNPKNIERFISPGAKGNVRGHTFNKIVKENLTMNKVLSTNRFEVSFEKHHPLGLKNSERPDWCIYDKRTKKLMIGMNQLDIWGGGQQINRGKKYIFNNDNDVNKKVVCVVCNDVCLKTDKNELYKLFENGFKNKTLCYILGLDEIIEEFFGIDLTPL